MKTFWAPFGRLRIWSAVGAIGAAVLAWGVARVSGVDMLLWQVALLTLSALAASSVVSALRPDTEPGPELVTRKVNTPTWRPFNEVNRWEDRLIFAETKPGRFEGGNAKTTMVELVEERLRLRRGLSLTGDPEQCRELLGARTFAFLTRPVPDCPTETQLDEHLRRIEDI